jgi:cysteine sulfinate desulfinase/cysteine desulfurase-like protein
LRFSLGRHTTDAEVNSALEIIPAAVSQLRALSPAYHKQLASQQT